MPVEIDGSLNDLIVRAPGFPFWTVAFAHFKISMSLMGRPAPLLESAESVFVMFILRDPPVSTHVRRRE